MAIDHLNRTMGNAVMVEEEAEGEEITVQSFKFAKKLDILLYSVTNCTTNRLGKINMVSKGTEAKIFKGSRFQTKAIIFQDRHLTKHSWQLRIPTHLLLHLNLSLIQDGMSTVGLQTMLPMITTV